MAPATTLETQAAGAIDVSQSFADESLELARGKKSRINPQQTPWFNFEKNTRVKTLVHLNTNEAGQPRKKAKVLHLAVNTRSFFIPNSI